MDRVRRRERWETKKNGGDTLAGEGERRRRRSSLIIAGSGKADEKRATQRERLFF